MARNFNGTSDTITVSKPSFGAQGTICLFAKHNHVSTTQFIFDSDVNRYLLLNLSSGQWLLWIDGTPIYNSFFTLTNDGVWTHVAVSWDSTHATEKVRTYSDGSVVKTDNVSFGSNSTGSLYIGKRFTSIQYYDGDMAEFAVYGERLSAEEVASLANGVKPNRVRPNELLAYWEMSSLNASTEPDLSGNGNHGTVTGTTKADHAPVGFLHDYAWQPMAAIDDQPSGSSVATSLLHNATNRRFHYTTNERPARYSSPAKPLHYYAEN